jgi:hypothetical protein
MRFNGDKKADKPLLHDAETRLKEFLVPLVPQFVETYHLTLSSLIWCVFIIAFGFLSRYDRHWLWGTSLMIVLQYITDLLDGEIGRRRDTGLVKWGYFMDHFLDYLFLCSLLIGYSFLITDHGKIMLFFILALFGGFMVNSYLSFAATNSFKITFGGIGPTEIRIFFILANIALIYLPGNQVLEKALPVVLVISVLGLFLNIFSTQKQLWIMDMKEKARGVGKNRSKIIAQERSRIRNLRILRNYSFSFFFILSALIVYYFRLLYPFTRIATFILLVLGLFPYLMSILLRRTQGKKTRSAVETLKTILTYLVFAVLLSTSVYMALILIPPKNGRTISEIKINDISYIRADVIKSTRTAEDLEKNMSRLQQADLKTGSGISQFRTGWLNLMKDFRIMDGIHDRYQIFYQVDYQSVPDLHARAFYLSFSAYLIKYRAGISLIGYVIRSPEIMKLIDRDARFVLIGKQYRTLKDWLLWPDNVLRLKAGLQYFRLIRGRLSASDMQVIDIEKEIGDVLEKLDDIH